MSKILGPESDAQVRQLFTDPALRAMRDRFVKAIVHGLKFSRHPRLGERLEREIGALVDLPDSEIYARLRRFVHDVLFKDPSYVRKEGARDKNRAEDVRALLVPKFLRPGSVYSYLDVGCNEGSITSAVGAAFGAREVHGCDVIAPAKNPTFVFKLLRPCAPNELPYGSQTMDLVSAFMSLHHIPNIGETLDEIRAVMRDRGIFVIREHDLRPPELALLLDVMHAFYAMVWSDPPEMPDFRSHFSHYRTREDMRALIESHGFRCTYLGEPRGPWEYYYAVFEKNIRK